MSFLNGNRNHPSYLRVWFASNIASAVPNAHLPGVCHNPTISNPAGVFGKPEIANYNHFNLRQFSILLGDTLNIFNARSDDSRVARLHTMDAYHIW